MRVISAAALAELQKLNPPKPLACLYEINPVQTTIESPTAYLTSHDQPVTWSGNTYEPFPIGHERVPADMSGSLPEMEIAVSNVTRELSQLVFESKGLAGMPVVLRIVNLNALASGDVIFSIPLTGITASIGNLVVVLRVGAPAFLEYLVPSEPYNRSSCRHPYRGEVCAYRGSIPTCDRTVFGPNGCEVHGQDELANGVAKMHPRRNGSFPAMPRIAV